MLKTKVLMPTYSEQSDVETLWHVLRTNKLRIYKYYTKNVYLNN